jgi:hypothetical protein
VAAGTSLSLQTPSSESRVEQAALIRGYIRGQVKSREAAVGLSGREQSNHRTAGALFVIYRPAGALFAIAACCLVRLDFEHQIQSALNELPHLDLRPLAIAGQDRIGDSLVIRHTRQTPLEGIGLADGEA